MSLHWLHNDFFSCLSYTTTVFKSADLSSRCACRVLRTSAPHATPRKTVARRSLKAKGAATAATVAASAQTLTLRTSVTEEHSLALPASHLGASDYDEDYDEDEDGDDDETSENDYEKAFHGSRDER